MCAYIYIYIYIDIDIEREREKAGSFSAPEAPISRPVPGPRERPKARGWQDRHQVMTN